MRLWSLSPAQLDRRALVACWREALLAQKVLAGGTRGYTRHPQLIRFRALPDPQRGIATYLHGLADGAESRGYRFNRGLITLPPDGGLSIPVTAGQMEYEWRHLTAKVLARDPQWQADVLADAAPTSHPLFHIVPGEVEDWEIV